MLDQPLRQRCLDMIKALPVPDPFDLEQFRVNLEHQRHRTLKLIPTQTKPDCSGVWIAMSDADCIFYERDTTQLHQLHIIGHESGHMIFGHRGLPISDSEFARLLFPDLPPELVSSFLARSAYTDTEEEEAETFASLLLDHIKPAPPPPQLPASQAALLHRVEGAFTRPRSAATAGARP